LAQDKTQYAWEHFQDYLNVIIHEDNSPYNFFDTLVRIFKAFHILDQRSIWNQQLLFVFYFKTSTTNNGMVEVTKWANKLSVVSIDDIHVTNFKIEN
jgi:hypothetical protein